ncbi:MAG: anthranilate synthase component I, partial [Alphaproteobacteria bacterium]|nr:anthranilate synthase component I [Alphaproteobacteria bacterium]
VAAFVAAGDSADGILVAPQGVFPEEQRSRQPSIFSVVRSVVETFASDEDPYLGLYGAFGYDLVFQFEPVPLARPRPEDQRDLVAFLPDRLTMVDYHAQRAFTVAYDFETEAGSTAGLPRATPDVAWRGRDLTPDKASDYAPGGYAKLVEEAMPYFARGDLFEVVPGQTFYRRTEAPPSVLFETLRKVNPSPYGFIFNLGGEYLIGASPEMYVRIEGRRVETCPISGTIPRGRDPIEDAERIRQLLNSAKDEAELTMCTDVDRNDKSRICEPGSVRVLGRRQIEMYSHLIHTVDHVEGLLRPEFDALDAFLTHCWAVTVTGAPKPAAIRWIEERETSPRRFYGGAVGRIGFDGGLNTGLVLRTLRVKDGIAELRVGATLLHDSIPEEEEKETLVKGAALFRTLELAAAGKAASVIAPERVLPGRGRRVLFIDCEDSFVHTLAGYFRAQGAEIETLRHGQAREALERDFDLVVLSPGPGRPEEFGVPDLVRLAVKRELPVFGVCLGFQGIVEAFGGRLGTLPVPRHGKASRIHRRGGGGTLLGGLDETFVAGRYHSLFAVAEALPAEIEVTAESEDGVIMAIEHRTLPVAGVQFHPESIMSLGGDAGPAIVANVLAGLAGRRRRSRAA